MRVARRGRASHPEAIATLTNSRDARSVTAVRDYTATLAAVMQESEDLRVALSSRRPRAGSDTSDDDGDGEATARGDAGTAASASVALADRVRALGHACCALEAGEGRRVVLQRCRSLIAAVKPVVVGELEGAVEEVTVKAGLHPEKDFMLKVVQLEELLAIRHCVFHGDTL